MSRMIDLTDESFEKEVTTSDLPYLVDFWAEWCGPCVQLEVTLREVATELEGTVRVGRVNIAAHPGLADAYAVKSVPTMLVFRGGAIAKRMYGAKSKPLLLAELGTFLA